MIDIKGLIGEILDIPRSFREDFWEPAKKDFQKDVLGPYLQELSHDHPMIHSTILKIFPRMERKSKQLSFGDIIWVQRPGYKHFGVFASKNEVIHYTGQSLSEASVRKTSLNEFLEGSKRFYICVFPESYGKYDSSETLSIFNNSLACGPSGNNFFKIFEWLKRNQRYSVFSDEETVERARSRLGENQYRLFSNNCEHFAIWCKTGINQSWQIEELLDATHEIKIPCSSDSI